MKKIIMVALLLSSTSYGKIFDIGKFSNNIANKNMNKLVSEITASSHLKNVVIKKVALKELPVDVVGKVALSISNKSPFADKLIATTSLPTDVIRQYAKYGDNYLTTIKEFNQKSLSLSPERIKSLKEKFPTMPKIEFKNSTAFNDKMVETLRFTGKKGWMVSQKLLKIAKENPKSSVVAGLYAWYVTDPQSFFEQKDKLIGFVGSTLEEGASDVTKLTLGASSGVVGGFVSVFKEKATVLNIFFLLLMVILFIAWKLRSYIMKYFKIKLENSLEKEKKKNKGLL